MALEITDANFDELVAKSDKPVLLDFWAEWCGPCRAIGPKLEEIAQEMGGKVKIMKVDVDSNQNTAAQFGIRSIPTMIMFKGGKPVEQIMGKRINQFGVAQPNIQKDAVNNRLYIELPGVQDEATVADKLQSTANLQFFETYTKEELQARAAKAQFDNSLPDPNGNNMLFGQRQECIKPTLLNSMREKLGYNPKYASPFNQCQTKRF